MPDLIEAEDADTLTVEGDAKSSARIIAAIKRAERVFNAWQAQCDRIDEVYEGKGLEDRSLWTDVEYDLFWSSTEVLKPAIYARPPQPVVSPQFKDRRKLQNLTADVLERSVTSAFDRTNLDEGMLCVRDDLIFYNRGQLWVTYETDEGGGGQRICVEHVDRKDYLHPPARKFSDLPWQAKRAWLTKSALEERFGSEMAKKVPQSTRPSGDDDVYDVHRQGGADYPVWEVWHRVDKKVYWAAEGCDEILDSSDPHLNLRGFFPCPRPAYGTLRNRTLMPVPDYGRYEPHFNKINSLTKRIYDLLDSVRMKGLIPAGGDVGAAVEQLMNDDSNASMLIPVPSAALTTGSGSFVQWMPLAELAAAITGLIEARRELFADYDRLSGISDIMRGETDAQETLGAQQLKSQYGSTRVREKVDELQRIARDVTEIAAEIIAEKFSQATLLEMSQMEILTRAEIKERIKQVESDAKEELQSLTKKAEGMIAEAKQSGQEADPKQAQQQFEQAKQGILKQFAPVIHELNEMVPIEAVMDLLRDDKARGFAFEIETDSTIMTDELQEKANRNEFANVFSQSIAGYVQLAALGEPAAKLAGGVLKFWLQPYRVGRELNGLIDDFIDSAPEMAAAANKDGSAGDQKELIEANKTLAQAEATKAQAALMGVQAKAAQSEAENQRKMGELQTKVEKDRMEYQIKMAAAQTAAGDAMTKAELIAAQIDKLRSEIAVNLSSIGLDARKQDLDEYKAATSVQMDAANMAMGQENSERDAAMQARQQDHTEGQAAHEGQMAERQQEFSENQGERTEERADRQQTFAERQAALEKTEG